jgi:hypothetical protein
MRGFRVGKTRPRLNDLAILELRHAFDRSALMLRRPYVRGMQEC